MVEPLTLMPPCGMIPGTFHRMMDPCPSDEMTDAAIAASLLRRRYSGRDGVAPAPLPKVPKTATIDGTWEVVERHVNGRRDDSAVSHPLDDHGGVACDRDEGRAGFRRVAGFTYRLVKPAGGRAGEIDYVLTPADGDTPPSAFRGRFELDGDTLKVCRSHSPEQDRPAGCEPSADMICTCSSGRMGGRRTSKAASFRGHRRRESRAGPA